MSQQHGRPARFIQGLEPNLLDLVIGNNELLVSEIVHDNPIAKSDHEVSTFELHINLIVIDNANMYQYNLKKRPIQCSAKLL